MKRYRLFLAFYSLIVTIVLFIWSIFYSPKQEGFLLTLILLPTSIYFLLLIGGVSKPHSPPENQERDMKLPLIILMTLFISSASILAYSTVNNRSFNSNLASLPTLKQFDSFKIELEAQNKAFCEDIFKEFAGLKNQLTNMKTTQKITEDTEALGDTTPAVGTITIIDKKYPTVNVYTEKSTSSAVIGKAEFSKTYTFIDNDQNWYLILLGAKEGFISSRFVKEIQY